jgi:hypothetical protein
MSEPNSMSVKTVPGLTRLALKLDIASQTLADVAANIADINNLILQRFHNEVEFATTDMAAWDARLKQFRDDVIKNLLDEV